MAADKIRNGRRRVPLVEGAESPYCSRPISQKPNRKGPKREIQRIRCHRKDYNQNQLWLVDVSAAERTILPVPAKQVTTDRALNVNAFAWSPDSTRVAFSATHNPLLAYGGEEDIYLLDLAHGNTVSKIVALPGPDTSPMFSPDGKQLAFYTSFAQPFYYYANGHIAAVDCGDSACQARDNNRGYSRPDPEI